MINSNSFIINFFMKFNELKMNIGLIKKIIYDFYFHSYLNIFRLIIQFFKKHFFLSLIFKLCFYLSKLFKVEQKSSKLSANITFFRICYDVKFIPRIENWHNNKTSFNIASCTCWSVETKIRDLLKIVFTFFL